MAQPRNDPNAWIPWALWGGGLLPGATLLYRGLTGDLGANPISEGLNACGELAIKLLLLCLACTPLRIVFGFTAQMRARKHLGLLAFTYAMAHFSVYLGLDRLGDLASVPADVAERPFILVGFLALCLLVPLAITSSVKMVKRLGARRWNRLHSAIYVIGILAVVHFVMRAKKDVTEAAIHGAVLAVLLGVRVFDKVRRAVRTAQLQRG
ncbi:MAG TPA: protein-methionine-sulfoxide reductase heme-binding subunit MsrQ [Polyangiaceae bacterium]|jgi:sulfoxide reductase heme-binding subunit YedZ|nr:protein-methionine-sulfoxide reductase heme-binding subunit MsrQ [Polyangiaceae bacterium]